MFEYFSLILFYLASLAVIGFFIYRSYRQQAFSFHLLFSLIYLATFYLGFPFSITMALGFESALPSKLTLFLTLCYGLVGYLIFHYAYHFFLKPHSKPLQGVGFDEISAKPTACLLGVVAVGSLIWFGLMNGFLLFELEKYSQIFSAGIRGTALKRFFYFFVPALLIFFFLKPSQKRWLLFLLFGTLFGTFCYVIVGGTRANMVLPLVIFFLLGVQFRYLSAKWVFLMSGVMIVAMFVLAMIRYGLDVKGAEAFFTFLYLTRDTFSPWENVAIILSKPMEFQGLMPIVRDFYVYLPKGLWLDYPTPIWNTANYFTRELLGNYSGLAISPTLLGSLYIMGGVPMILLGMAFVGIIIKGFDRLFAYANARHSAILQTFCLANVFNLIVLVREGADAFFSRFVFFSLVFGVCWLVAQGIVRVMQNDR